MTNFNRADDMVDIAIIGAGIGGAAAALALEQAGFDVAVFEQAPALREVGGAIIIREPSMKLFDRWGVLDDLRFDMVAISEIEMRDGDGKVTGATPISFQANEGDIAYSVHRADVHGALAAQIPAGRLHLGHRLDRVESFGDHAEARFENGDRIRARLIVGADGLRSRVRNLIDDTPMTFAKMVTHRTIAPATLMPADMRNDRLRMWQSDRLIVITLPVRSGAAVAIDAVIPAETPPEKLWSSAPADELLSVYADFDPLIGRLIRGRTVDVTTHPVYDKDPIARWTDGRVVLIGDAAHPMAPMQGQGANQAIQDAGALADALIGQHYEDQPAALAAFQSLRSPVTARLQTLSRNPPELPEGVARHAA